MRVWYIQNCKRRYVNIYNFSLPCMKYTSFLSYVQTRSSHLKMPVWCIYLQRNTLHSNCGHTRLRRWLSGEGQCRNNPSGINSCQPEEVDPTWKQRQDTKKQGSREPQLKMKQETCRLCLYIYIFIYLAGVHSNCHLVNCSSGYAFCTAFFSPRWWFLIDDPPY